MKKLIMKQVMMNRVLYALVPILLWAIFLFGWRVLVVVAITNLAAFWTEYAFVRTKKNGKVSMAVFVTGTLLALVLPPTIPFWIAAVGAVVAVAFGKMVFGGFGMNVFNPAIVGRTFVYISFAKAMTVQWAQPFTQFPGGFLHYRPTMDALTSATPMIQFRDGGVMVLMMKSFLGLISGSMGETSALLILLAAAYLIVTKTAKWQPMLATVLSFGLFTTLFYGQNPLPFLLTGGFLFGTVFMITDPVSMPKEKYSIWIYGILVGFLTAFIRKYSLFVEGFMFAILLGNTFMPIIEFGIKKWKQR